MQAQFYVYILGNDRPTLYIGVTRNLAKRIDEHQQSLIEGFTQKYGLKKLLYIESFDRLIDAIAREKQLKHWNREWKLNLIRERNPLFQDLSSSF